MADLIDRYAVLVQEPVSIPSCLFLKHCYDAYLTGSAPCMGGATNQCAVRMSVAPGGVAWGWRTSPDPDVCTARRKGAADAVRPLFRVPRNRVVVALFSILTTYLSEITTVRGTISTCSTGHCATMSTCG